MRVARLVIFAVLALAVASPAAFAFDAVAASPDGGAIVVGGANRAIYVCSAPDWQVTKRIWFSVRIQQIDFVPDGSQCVVVGDDDTAHIFKTADWTELTSLKRLLTMIHARPLAVAAKAPVAVTLSGRAGGGITDIDVKVWSLPDWTEQRTIVLPEGTPSHSIAISADGKLACVRTRPIDDPKEKETDAGPEPTDSVARQLWRALQDGKASDALIIDVEKGKVLRTARCFDWSYNYRTYVAAGAVVFADYSRYLGRIDLATGAYSVMSTGQFAYGSGLLPDGNILLGGLAAFVVITPEGKQLDRIAFGRLPGFPEYFHDFAPLGKDAAVGVTDACRLVFISAASHGVTRIVPVY